jgi:cytoskeletal protein RodZ
MTTRDRSRRRTATPADARPAGIGAPDIDSAAGAPAQPGPPTSRTGTSGTLPERLLAAREDKGVDLTRAERDTKIRARYLAALEHGEWRDLPGAVYTKGFLRNYALYLGLDPDEILEQWRLERGDASATVEPSIVVPRPISAPRQGVTISRGLFVGLFLVLVVAGFVGYLAIQLTRFARPPTVTVTDPATAVSDVDEATATYVLRGESQPGVSITISAPGREPIRVTADETGAWSAEVELRRGRNQFDVDATDPETGKVAEQPARIFISVPYAVAQAPSLTVDQPADGATFENGAIPIEGTATNASTVAVSATYSGPAPGEGPRATTDPSPPPAKEVKVGTSGTYSTGLDLTTGRWAITVTASSAQGKSTTIERDVTVMYRGVNLVVEIKGGPAWIKVWIDGDLEPSIGAAGRTFNSGRTLTFRGEETVEVRTGSSGSTYFTVNGTSLGRLGKAGVPETWLFAPPAPPRETQRR